MPPVSGTVLWLLPDGTQNLYFTDAIKHYSDVYGAPVFTPHSTLGRFPDEDVSTGIRLIEEISTTQKPLLFYTKDPECRENPYQKVVIPLKAGKAYQQLCNTIDQRLGGDFSKREDPHISLMYSRLECTRLQKPDEEIPGKLPESVAMNEVAIVELSGPPNRWKVLARRKFQAFR